MRVLAWACLACSLLFTQLSLPQSAAAQGRGGSGEDAEYRSVVEEALQEYNRRNWEEALPTGQRRVATVRELVTADEVRAHPLGKFGVKQTVVPLNLTRDIQKFGSTTPANARRFSITRMTVGTTNIPIGPTGRIIAAFWPASRDCLIARAISWPIMTSKSATDSQETGSKAGCHQGWRSPIVWGGCEQQRSIRARSQPRGRKPSIIEPA